MTVHMIWALVAVVWALVLWDMVRRWAFATATRTLKAQLDGVTRDLNALADKLFAAQAELRGEHGALCARIEERGFEKLPARVKQLEVVVSAIKQHVEKQAAFPNPFAARKEGA